MKAPAEPVAVIKETAAPETAAPAKPKKNSKKNQ
jgi:hypothetical protein